MNTITSYTTNFELRGHIFHVQTEDKSKFYPIIETLVYSNGLIIYALKTSYAHYLHSKNLMDIVLMALERQHQKIVTEIRQGKVNINTIRSLSNRTQSSKVDLTTPEAEVTTGLRKKSSASSGDPAP